MPPETQTQYCIVGGAGFIGSHFTDRLLSNPKVQAVTLYDKFSSGRAWHYEQHLHDPRMKVERGDVADLETLVLSVSGHDVVIHLASNPDIAPAATEPEIDFYQGTLLTNNVVEAMRRGKVSRLLFMSTRLAIAAGRETSPSPPQYGPYSGPRLEMPEVEPQGPQRVDDESL
jgi:UDP-glucose 4-epimerase